MINSDDLAKESCEVRQKHLNLDTPCVKRGGNSTHYKGVLAEYLGTTIPQEGQTLVCHACGHLRCSNPEHLYFGRDAYNVVGLNG